MKNGLGIYLFEKQGYYYGFFKDGEREGYGELSNKQHKIIYKGFWKKG